MSSADARRVPGRIVSGGQSGVDRAALDYAIGAGIPYGGWCPHDGWAEDLPTPPGLRALYPDLRPVLSQDLRERTRANVVDSDATLILIPGPDPSRVPSRGTRLTVSLAARLGRPHRVVALGDPAARDEVAGLVAYLAADFVLNVAGPRESGAPGVYRSARAFLAECFGSEL